MAEEEVEDVRMEPPWLPPPLLPLDEYQGPLSHLCPRINLSILNSPVSNESDVYSGSLKGVSSSFSASTNSSFTGKNSSVSSPVGSVTNTYSINTPALRNLEKDSSVAAASMIISTDATDPRGCVESGAPTPIDNFPSSSSSHTELRSGSVPMSLDTAQAFSRSQPFNSPHAGCASKPSTSTAVAPLADDSQSGSCPVILSAAPGVQKFTDLQIAALASSSTPNPTECISQVTRGRDNAQVSSSSNNVQLGPRASLQTSSAHDVTQCVFTTMSNTSSRTHSSSSINLERPLKTGLNSKSLVSTSADALHGRGSTTCQIPLLCSTPQSSLSESLSHLPKHLASFCAGLTASTSNVSEANAPASEASLFRADTATAVTGTTGIGGLDLGNCREGESFGEHLNLPSGFGFSTVNRDTRYAGAAVVVEPESAALSSTNTCHEEVLLMSKSAADGMGSSSEQTKILDQSCDLQQEYLVHGLGQARVDCALVNSAFGGSKGEQELVEEGELEEGQVSGEWEHNEESDADDVEVLSDVNLKDTKESISGEGDKHSTDEYEEEEGVIDYRTEGLTPVVVNYGVDRNLNQAAGSIGDQFGKQHNKNTKRRKGKGALARQRKKARLEKVQKDIRGLNIQVNGKGVQQDDGSTTRSNKRMEPSGDIDRKAGVKRDRSGGKKAETDTGPEEGEVIKEENKGLLSMLVEDEVGLWTTDFGDEHGTSSKVDSDDGDGKKVRGPISAERKAKKKMAFRRKRAEKEKEQGIRRPRLQPSTSKPPIVPCKFYMKGRCTLGDKCTFSHDGVPITKSDPCKFFMIGRCLKGDECPFSHSLGVFPCKFWHTRGYCLDGNNCRFSHGPLTEEQRQNLTKRIEHDSKEQQNVLEVPTDLVVKGDSAYDYNPTMNTTPAEAQDWQSWNMDVDPYEIPIQDRSCHESKIGTSAHSTFPDSRNDSPATSQPNVSKDPVAWSVDTSREDTKTSVTSTAETHKEENCVLLAARKAATAAAEQAACTSAISILLSRSSPCIPQPRTRSSLARPSSFKNMGLAGRGVDSSAMELLQASLGSDVSSELRDETCNPDSKAEILSSMAGVQAIGATDSRRPVGKSLLSGPLLMSSSRLTHSGSLGSMRQPVLQASRASAMELLQASFGSNLQTEATKANPEGAGSDISQSRGLT